MNKQNYTTRNEVKDLGLVDWKPEFNTRVDEWIGAMSRYIDDYCNVIIYDNNEQTYKYDGNNEKELLIDMCHDISEIKLNDDVITPHKYPANTPYTYKLERGDNVFDGGNQNVEVTAKFSKYTEVPDDISYACAVLVVGIINDQQNEDKRGISKDIGNFSVSFTNDAGKTDLENAMRILKKHKHIAI